MSVIAATKLEMPPRREGLVPRGTLVSLLAGAEHTRLTMLSAPAGSGKTTLLQQWRLAAADQPFACRTTTNASPARSVERIVPTGVSGATFIVTR